MKKLIIICLILALVVIIVLLGNRRNAAAGSSTTQGASLLFVGMTNLPTGAFAIFCFSNSSKPDIACIPVAIEQAGTGTFVRTPLTGAGSRAVRDWIGVRDELKPGEAFTFLVPRPTTGAQWRVIFLCQEQTLVVDPVYDTVKRVVDSNAMKTRLQRFSGRRYEVSSSEVPQ